MDSNTINNFKIALLNNFPKWAHVGQQKIVVLPIFKFFKIQMTNVITKVFSTAVTFLIMVNVKKNLQLNSRKE